MSEPNPITNVLFCAPAALMARAVAFPVPGSLSKKYSALVKVEAVVAAVAFNKKKVREPNKLQCPLLSTKRMLNVCVPAVSELILILKFSLIDAACVMLSEVPLPLPGSLSKKYSARWRVCPKACVESSRRNSVLDNFIGWDR